MSRVLITGASGLLGGNLMYVLPAEWDVIGVGNRHLLIPSSGRAYWRADFLSDNADESVEAVVKRAAADVIIHAAALTNVDRCEYADRGMARRMHVKVSERLAQEAKKNGALLVHISTDQVFDGERGLYAEDDVTNPLNYYAETKRAAEERILASGADALIVRTNFFGYNAQEKDDIAGWMFRGLREARPLRLFTDVIFSPILVNTLIDILRESILKRLTGVYHIAGRDAISKYEFGRTLAAAFGLDESTIVAASIDDANLAASRPKNMSLAVGKIEAALGRQMPTVEESIQRYKELYDDRFQEKLRKMLKA